MAALLFMSGGISCWQCLQMVPSCKSSQHNPTRMIRKRGRPSLHVCGTHLLLLLAGGSLTPVAPDRTHC
eukprot:82962-Pelagomonas_calceolata.AAC.2